MSSLETRIIISARDMATGTMRKMELSLEGVRRRALAVGAVMATGLGFAYVAKQGLEAADKIGKVADKVGFTTDQLQELRYAGELAGVGVSQVDMGLQRFSRRLGEVAQGTGELKNTAAQYGVQLRDSEGRMRSNVEVLGDFADVIASAESEQERLRIAFKLFDSEGAALVNMLSSGSAGLNRMRADAQALGLVLDEDLVRGSERANDELTRMERVIRTQFTATVAQFAPEIAGAAANTLDWVRANRELIDQKVDGAINEMGRGLSSIKTIYDAIPEEVRGAAGIGLVGTALLGVRGGVVLAGAVHMVDVLKNTMRGFEEVGAGALDMSDFASMNARELDAYLEKLDKLRAARAADAAVMQNGLATGTIAPAGLEFQVAGKKSPGAVVGSVTDEAAKALAKVRDGFAKLTMTSDEYARHQFEEKYKDLAKALGEANPELAQYAAFQRQVLDALATTPEKDRLLEIAEKRREAFDLLKQVDAVRRAQAEASGAQQTRDLQLLTEFSQKFRETVTGDYEFKIAQIEESGRVYREAGANEEALAKLVAAEKRKLSREFVDGWGVALDEYVDATQNAANQAKDLFNDAAGAMEGSLSDVFFDGMRGEMDSSKEYFDAFLQSLERSLAEFLASEVTSGMIKFLSESLSSSSSGSGSSGGGIFGFIASMFHEGGVAGVDGTPRVVNPAVFAGAMRYHSGGIAGLRPDEVPAILQRGEPVFPVGTKFAAGGTTHVLELSVDNTTGQAMAAKGRVVSESPERTVIKLVLSAIDQNLERSAEIFGLT